MGLAATPEHDELRGVLRSFLDSRANEEAVRAIIDGPGSFDPAVWSELGQAIGVQGLAIPEEYGGSGVGLRELGIAFEEAGRCLLPAPLLGAFLASDLILAADDAQAAKEMLPGIASGELIATVGWLDAAGTGASDVVADGDRLTGTIGFVVDGPGAGHLVVPAVDGETTSLYAVDLSGPGVEVVALESLDLTRGVARIDLHGASARRLGAPGNGSLLGRTLDRGCALLAAEQAGAAGRVVEIAVEYAKIRQQFGRPIGSFQAIKHKCADMYLAAESARAAALYALWVADERPDELPQAAAQAKSYCSEAFVAVAAENIQVHGGIGFTYEHSAHLYFRRAKSTEVLLGSPRDHRERLAGMIGLDG